MKKWMFLSLSLMMLFVVSGCQSSNRGANEQAYNLRNDRSTPNFMSNRDHDGITPDNMSDRDKNQQHVVENDITNQNPNFLDLKGTGSGGEAGAGNQGNDIAKAKQVINGTNEFVTDSVWINGDRMWVSVYKKGTFSNQGKIDAEARLHRKLVQAIPRYNIEVRVKEDRR
ncbi:hypothetical protein [Neobacillus soli]|uniref:hypothetical protein n=1 Tax=Neobacillus soli TaxID=220688 RepID=UPI000825B0F5|nr:hypothetical protein [Neobacillus soli]